MEFDVRIEVSQLPGILDPEGATVERSLPTMGWDNVRGVRIGKSIRLTIEAPSEEAARTQIDEMCRKLLANPVIESYEIHLRELSETTR